MTEIDLVDDESAAIDIPPPADWSAAAVRLLQGVVYHDSEEIWESIVASVSPLREYFGRLSLVLVVDESEGMAYLRQLDDDEMSPDHERVGRLFRRTKLSYDASLLCVLLRDELRRFEEEDVNNERCVITESELLETWQAFYPQEQDQVRLAKHLRGNLKKIEGLKFIRVFEKEPPSWEIRRILKARLTIEQLETLRQELLEAASKIPEQEESSAAAEPEQIQQTGIIFEAS